MNLYRQQPYTLAELNLLQNQRVEPVQEPLSQKMGRGIGEFLFDQGVISDPRRAYRTGQTMSGILGFMPGIGDAQAGDEFATAAQEGDALGMGIGLMSAVPVAGKAVKPITKAVEDILPPPENAQRTQIATTTGTYKKAREILGKGKTLDFGAGLGKGAKEIGADTYEPFPKDWNPNFTDASSIPSNSYPKITNLNVLNVVPKSIRDGIVQDIGRVLKPGGTAIITTRGRDVMDALKSGKAGPEPMSVITSRDTYQKGFTQKELKEYIQETLGDNFEVINNKLGAAGVTVKKKV